MKTKEKGGLKDERWKRGRKQQHKITKVVQIIQMDQPIGFQEGKVIGVLHVNNPCQHAYLEADEEGGRRRRGEEEEEEEGEDNDEEEGEEDEEGEGEKEERERGERGERGGDVNQ